MCLDWPGNSPDLNPIENLWYTIKKKLAEKKPKSLAELRNCVKNIWEKSITPDILQSLVLSMPNRIKNVIKAKGGVTKY